MTEQYQQFLEDKIPVAEGSGFEVTTEAINPMLWRHQPDIVRWGLLGGRRAVFASFGLGKTFIQLEIAKHVVAYTRKPFLQALPLGVRYEFELDAEKLGYALRYVRNQQEAEQAVAEGVNILLSNYERIRDGQFDAAYFGGVSFDEASVLRSLDTLTTNYIIDHFRTIPYRFVCTATPSPNEYTEILNYAHFLGVMDRGQALTRFFQRDSKKANNLTIHPHKEREFWMWVSTWAVFITKPSDLGYSDEGYDLPKLNIHRRMVTVKGRTGVVNRDGQIQLIADSAAGLQEAAKEKRESIPERVTEMMEIIGEHPQHTSFLLWHHLEKERKAIEDALPGVKTVYGSQKEEEREDYLIGFGRGDFEYLATKPSIAGSGCNFQRFCHNMIMVGIDYNFNEFIQAIHRIYRFLQMYEVNLYLIYTDGEEHILKTLFEKWARYNEMIENMTAIIKTYGLNRINIQTDLKRNIGVNRKEVSGKYYKCVHNDNVPETMTMKDNSVGLIVTSIPFSDQYEYSESYHDMGHNDGNAEFFRHMDFLTPELLRVVQPGRIACIHVKDRIRYSYQNGQGFTSLEDFSGATVQHFTKHGWHLMGKITITTDVVQENNQTYRLGYSEMCKDGTKMGVGLPEYLLIFRKPTTDKTNAYADIPVTKNKSEYSLGRWQLDAHAHWASSGERLFDPEWILQQDLKRIGKTWREFAKNNRYDFAAHVALCDMLDGIGRLSKKYMAVPPQTHNNEVWTDVSRMLTLNSKQMTNKQEKHVCPLQFDIVDRCITRYSNTNDVVYDPFGGIMTVPYRAIMLGRYGVGCELNEQYWKDGARYCRDAEVKKAVPTLFDNNIAV